MSWLEYVRRECAHDVTLEAVAGCRWCPMCLRFLEVIK